MIRINLKYEHMKPAYLLAATTDHVIMKENDDLLKLKIKYRVSYPCSMLTIYFTKYYPLVR